jgi:predicted GNAT family N-acyltransferase
MDAPTRPGTPVDLNNLIIRTATLEEILPLREAVLIRGTGRPSQFPNDTETTTVHFCANLGGAIVCCATFLVSEWEGRPAYQLRGMATETSVRGRGIGARLLAFAEEYLMTHSRIRILWCNARSRAVPFYKKQGWDVVSDEFDVPNVGPHVKMRKRLPDG